MIAPFSWEAKGKTAAELQYDADALKAEQNALASRREFMAAAEEGQTLKDTQKYLDAQSAEKAGWTGGYRLDQNRQRQYLEASIQASMYNSQEMARFGYETSLDAARIAYEQGKEALALEYYKVELDKATAEAQLTGVYFSPEQKDMIFQYRTADQIFSNPASSQEEKDKAGRVINTIKDWFSASGLSQDGIKTLAKIDSDRQDRLMKQSILASAIETVPDGAYPLRDSKGNYLFSEDGISLQYFLPNIASNQEKYNYFSGNYTVNGQVVESGKGVYRTELNKLHSDTITTWFNSLSNADKDLSATELETRLRNYITEKNINPLHKFTQGIVSDTGSVLDFDTILKEDPNYKNGEYSAKHAINGKEFNVTYNLKTGAVKVNGVVGQGTLDIDNKESEKLSTKGIKLSVQDVAVPSITRLFIDSTKAKDYNWKYTGADGKVYIKKGSEILDKNNPESPVYAFKNLPGYSAKDPRNNGKDIIEPLIVDGNLKFGLWDPEMNGYREVYDTFSKASKAFQSSGIFLG